MPKSDRTKANVIYSPTVLRLNTHDHRASLEGNDVSLLSGRDPHETGSFRRMAAGRRVNTATPSFPEHNGSAVNGHVEIAKFYQQQGVYAGHVLRTKLTAATAVSIGDTSKALPVVSTLGWAVGDWAVVFVPGSTSTTLYSLIGNVTSIAAQTLTITFGDSAHNWTIPVSAQVIQASAMASTGSTGTVLTSGGSGYYLSLDTLGSDIRNAQSVYVVGQETAYDDITTEIREITLIYGKVIFLEDTALTHRRYGVVALIPVIDDYDEQFAITSFSEGSIQRLGAEEWTEVRWPASFDEATDRPWRTTSLGNDIVIMNGLDRPKRLGPDINRGLGSFVYPSEYLGWKEVGNLTTAELSTIWTAGSGYSATAGDHNVFVRFVDKSVTPFAYSPPVAKHRITVGANGAIILNFERLLGNQANIRDDREVFECYRRSTHLQIWVSLTGGGMYFLAEENHIGAMFYGTNSGGYRLLAPQTAHYVYVGSRASGTGSMSDTMLAAQDYLDPSDMNKGLPPNGKYVCNYNGMLFVAGVTDSTADNEYPKISSANQLHFSRPDKDEPENFTGAYRTIGDPGDSIRGLVIAGSSMLVLNRFSWAKVQRLGTELAFFEGGNTGQGLAWEDAYCPTAVGAAWVSDKAVMWYDDTNQTATNIGQPIRDWIENLRSELTATGDRVRIAYDGANELLWLGKIKSNGTVAEAKVWNPENRAWGTRENVVLDGPFNGIGVESGIVGWHLYRFGHLTCFRNMDDETTIRCVIEGGWDGDSYSQYMSGTVTAGQAGTVSSIPIPAGAPHITPSCLRGHVIHFFHTATGTESIRVITAGDGTTGSVSWATGVTISAGDTWTIGNIPFRLRLPPIRGEDPFVRKIARGFVCMLDNVDVPTATAPVLTIKYLSNFQDTLANVCQSGTITVASESGKIDDNFGSGVMASGKVIEVQIEQLAGHADFSLLYCMVPVSMTGTLATDKQA